MKGCDPVPATVCSALRSTADQSLHGFADRSSGCQGTGSLPALFVCLRRRLACCSAKRPRILLIQDLANQNADLSRFPQLQPPVPVRSSCRHLWEFQLGASDSGSGRARPRTGDRSFEPMPGKARGAVAYLVQSERHLEYGSSEAGCRPKVLWRYWRGLRELLTACRTAGRCVLILRCVCPGRCPQRKVRGEDVEPAAVAPATTLRSDCATVHPGLAIEPTQLSHSVLKQRLTSVLVPHMLHEPSISKRPLGVGSRAAPRTAKVFPLLPVLLFPPRLSPGILHRWRWRGWQGH